MKLAKRGTYGDLRTVYRQETQRGLDGPEPITTYPSKVPNLWDVRVARETVRGDA